MLFHHYSYFKCCQKLTTVPVVISFLIDRYRLLSRGGKKLIKRHWEGEHELHREKHCKCPSFRTYNAVTLRIKNGQQRGDRGGILPKLMCCSKSPFLR